jgi:hypothetical protein
LSLNVSSIMAVPASRSCSSGIRMF